jgi:hypothetical protein
VTAKTFLAGWRDEVLSRMQAAALSPEQMTVLAEELALLAHSAAACQHVTSELALSSTVLSDARKEIARLRVLEARGGPSAPRRPKPLRPRPVPADAAGSGRLRPDPRGAQTAADLIGALGRFRIWAGNPSYREMARRSGRRSAASTMCTVLRSRELPARLEVIDAIVEGCGGTEEDRSRFATAWRVLAMGEQAGSEPGELLHVQGTAPGEEEPP